MTEPVALALPCTVSVVIKTLNEARNIARAVESALMAVKAVGGEVIVADSHSTDDTVAVASHYPVRIVRLKNPGERCCGIGPQLGYQHARGRYVYILDGDMRMHPQFLVRAVAFMELHAEVGGVGGQVLEQNTTSLEFLARVERGNAHMQAGPVDRLDMGGLYRREAIESVGYFSDRNLHSYEELDLALRLTAAGWKLERLNDPAVDHYGHDVSPYTLLGKRWRSRYADGLGELLGAAHRTNRFASAWASVREARVYIAFAVWTSALVLFAALSALTGSWRLALWLLAATSVPWWVMVWRKRSIAKATYSIASWAVYALALVRGRLSHRINPMGNVASEVIK